VSIFTYGGGRPLVILMTSRSGSSMVSGIFAAHGLWYSEPSPDDYSVFGNYKLYENQKMKRWLKRYFNIAGTRFVSEEWNDQFMVQVNRIYPEGQRWFWKGGVMFWPLWRQLDPYVVFIRRPLEQAVSSAFEKQGHNTVSREACREMISARYRLMNQVRYETGGIDIRTDQVAEGNYETLQQAFAYCNLDFQPGLADDIVEPARWRHRA